MRGILLPPFADVPNPNLPFTYAHITQATRHKEEEYTAHLELARVAGRAGTTVPSGTVMLLTRSLVLVLRVPAGEVALEQRLDGIQVGYNQHFSLECDMFQPPSVCML